LYNRTPARIAPLQGSSRIKLTGAVEGEPKLGSLTSDLAAATAGAQLIFVDVPATAHAELAAAMVPLIKKSWGASPPLIVLHPGQTLGARHFAVQLQRAGIAAPPPICELQTALYTSRLTRAGEAAVLAIKRRVSVSVYPRSQLAAADALRSIYPQIIPAPSTLHTGLANLQGIIHPAVCLFNLARIDRGETFRIYREGLSPALGAVIERADRERLGLCAALGVKTPTAAQWFALSYGVAGASAVEAMLQVAAYEQLDSPTSLATRLIWEDVPTGLSPLLSLARALGQTAPTLHALSEMATLACGPTMLDGAWTLERLGLAGKNAAELRGAF
jgi:opine dehydrogenase